MLRTIFVVGLILVGIAYAVQGPFFALLFYLWLSYFRPEHWLWYDFVSQVNLPLIVGIVALLTSLRSVRDFRLNVLVGLILLFLAQSLFSTVASDHREWSTSYCVEFVKVIIISLLITFLVTDQKRYRTTLLVIGYSLGLEAAKQGWAQMILNPGATNNNPIPFLGDNNGVAVGMMMLVPIFIALSQTAKRRWECWLHRFFIVGLLYRGISTYSRGGFLAAGALAVIAFWRSPRKIRALVSMTVVAIVVLSVMPTKFWDRMGTITAPEGARDESVRGRVYFWQVALTMASAHPVAGVGFNGFSQSFDEYDVSGGAWGGERAVHSAWFGVLAEMGYPGLMLLVAVIVTALVVCRRVRRRSCRDPALRDFQAYAAGMQTSLIVYVVGVSFLNGQYNEMFWHFIGLTVALDRAHAAPVANVSSVLAVRRPEVRGVRASASMGMNAASSARNQ